jgi:hypothetical protein
MTAVAVPPATGAAHDASALRAARPALEARVAEAKLRVDRLERTKRRGTWVFSDATELRALEQDYAVARHALRQNGLALAEVDVAAARVARTGSATG